MKETIKKISKNLQTKIEKNISKAKLYEHLHVCVTESRTLKEFYKKLQQDPRYKLYESGGVIKGVIYNERHVLLFDTYIPNEHKTLIWNQLCYQAEKEARDNEITR